MKGNTTRYSIIIPVYNADKTLRRCLGSIINEDEPSMEIILINDGSTDGSMDICKEFADSDSRIMVISQDNAGPSSARNKGLDAASGKYVMFVDSDDHVLPGYFDVIDEAVLGSDPDVVFLSWTIADEAGKAIAERILPRQPDDYCENIRILGEKDMFGYTWNKVIRRDVIGHIRFDESVMVMEDEIFSCEIMEKPVKISHIYQPLYCYVRRADESLVDGTYQDYAIYLDKIYAGWKSMLPDDADSEEFIKKKSGHFSRLCYWYLMERDIDVVSFCKDLRNSRFFNESDIDDPFKTAVLSGSWNRLKAMRNKYRLKNRIASIKADLTCRKPIDI